MLAKGKPEAGPEDPANEPVVAAILRNPNRKHNAESPSPDIVACCDIVRAPRMSHSIRTCLTIAECSWRALALAFLFFIIEWEDRGRRPSGGNFWKIDSVHVIDQNR